jgi:hypothetical protein
MKKILVVLAAVVVLVGFSGSAVAAARDCDSNAIMWCGAYSKTEFAYKVVGGDGHNSAANLQGIYKSFGVSIDQMKLASEGTVTKSGKVIVGGKTVATNAKSMGREYMPGSTKQNGVWMRSTQTSFKSENLEAFVYMKNGVFQWAVIKACGNVVVATPVAKPAPKPKPVPVIPQEVPPAPTPAPVLPETGMDLPMAAALGTTSVGYGLRGYLRSKKQLVKALRHK